MRSILFAAVALVISSPAFASNWQLSGSTTTGVSIATSGSTTVTTFAAATNAGYHLSQSLAIYGKPSLALITGTGTTTTIFSIYAGLDLSFADLYKDAFHFFAAPGLSMVSSGTSATNFTFEIGFGKRIQLSDSLAYDPYASFTGLTSTSFVSQISIVPMSFTIFL